MKQIFSILFCLTFSMAMSAQTSGGQITRSQIKRSVRTSNSGNGGAPSKSHEQKEKSYTAKEMFKIREAYYDKRNYQDAIVWYKKAAELGLPDAQSELGHMYFNGEGVTIDYTEASKWLIKAANNEDVISQHTLGYMYMNGLGVVKNESEARKWYGRAASKYYSAAKSAIHTSGQTQLYNSLKL